MKRALIAGAIGLAGGVTVYKWDNPYQTKAKVRDVVSFPPVPNRAQQLSRLKTEEFDVLVIGGGATGAGCVLDAQTRGLSAALVERGDFSSGTSSRSTKLIHGGIRYLQNAIFHLDKEQWDLVCEALSERKNLLDSAPHLSAALPIMIPVYQWWKLPYYYAGTLLYDLVSWGERLKWSRVISKQTTLEEFPMLRDKNLKGAVVYYDGQQNDARMNVMLVLSAVREGAAASNYIQVVEILHNEEGRIRGALCRDSNTGEPFEVKAKSIINATGPFTDSIRKMDNVESESICSPSTGVHIVLPGYFSPTNMGLLDPETSDGRIIFFLPWERYTIAGTTDTPCEPHARPEATEREIQFILDEIDSYFDCNVKIRRGDVLAAWSGIRPLVRDPNAKNSAALSRNHVIETSESGMVTIAGGKWTTYRKMAEDAVSAATKEHGFKHATPCNTSGILVEGADNYHHNFSIELCQRYGFDSEVAEHLAHNYGTQAHELAKMVQLTGKRWPLVGKRLVADMPFIETEVKYAVQYEYACHVKDFIARRTRLAFLNVQATRECLPRVAELMAEELGWDEETFEAEIKDAEGLIASMGFKLGSEGAPQEKLKLSISEYNEYLKAFEELDKDKTGVLRPAELFEACQNLGVELSIQDAINIVNEVDTNRNGVIDLEEFLIIMAGGATERIVDNRLQRLVELHIKEERTERITTQRSGGGV